APAGVAPGDIRRAGPVRAPAETPLVDIRHPELPGGVTLRAKLESVHPGGSVKDRSVARMIDRALAEGAFDGRRLLDSTSGNAGIAYAQIGAARGVAVTLVVPANASPERLARIRAHGAELILTDPFDGYDATISRARALARRHPDRYWYANQYANPENWLAHYHGTGAEILEQWREAGAATSGDDSDETPVVRGSAGTGPDAFVSGIGTGGTLTGVARRFREADPQTRIVAVIPERFPGIEGLKPLGLPEDHVPELLDETLIDDRDTVTSEDAARRCAELARLGFFVGPSSGANVHVALELAASGVARRIATILPDTGERYVSTGLWEVTG
ncbi:MAG: PLP-dependent cysteine synthase family protein, partial [Gemmatimonadota bacterium]|nr:PLP-dependent cysteine synthase family protein [Gemmatimonadota bacterium]